MRSLGWDLVHYDWCLHKKKRLGHRHIQREGHVRTQGKTATYKPRKESPQEKSTLSTPWSWTSSLKNCEPWLVWLNGLSAGLKTKGLPVQFQVRVHDWVAAGSLVGGTWQATNRYFSCTLMFLSLSFSLPSLLSREKKKDEELWEIHCCCLSHPDTQTVALCYGSQSKATHHQVFFPEFLFIDFFLR